MKLRNVFSGFMTSALTFMAVAPSFALASPKRERPPQFILMSFDGSYSIPFWKETKKFADKYNIGFTYFISGVYFLSGEDKQLYQAPRHKAGKSDIGFGENHSEIQQRVEEIVEARQQGLEIGSHANGHYDGTTWTLNEWASEFEQFAKFIGDTFRINRLGGQNQAAWENEVVPQIKGFRAPLLGVNKELYQVLSQKGYTYDASGMDYSGLESGRYNWPFKTRDGRWNFPLQGIKLAGTGKKTVTMDYNILVSQCNNEMVGAGPTVTCKNVSKENLKTYEDETFTTYLSLFKKNYFGNRAPINIGHHFSLWNKGAYWKAMQRFAADVCTLEEVRCVTYTEMVTWLEQHPLTEIGAYQASQFTKMPAHPLNILGEDTTTLDVNAQVSMREQGEIVGSFAGRDFSRLQQLGAGYQWRVNGQVVKEGLGQPGKLHLTPEQAKDGAMVTLAILSKQKEVIGTSRVVRQNSQDWVWLQNTGWEQRVLKGDLPEAHAETSDSDLIESMRVR